MTEKNNAEDTLEYKHVPDMLHTSDSILRYFREGETNIYRNAKIKK